MHFLKPVGIDLAHYLLRHLLIDPVRKGRQAKLLPRIFGNGPVILSLQHLNYPVAQLSGKRFAQGARLRAEGDRIEFLSLKPLREPAQVTATFLRRRIYRHLQSYFDEILPTPQPINHILRLLLSGHQDSPHMDL